MNYYNEFDPFAAAWLRELIKQKLIPEGDVDERSITEIKAEELEGYNQCHFFAGIGGWSLALRMAGIQDDFEVWTGSCPCQPFSVAGQGKGFDDSRHLWPVFYRLIEKRKPYIVFGEQVAKKAGLGWLDSVFDDLENCGYACGSAVIPACGVGAPHLRERLFWVANTKRERLGKARKNFNRQKERPSIGRSTGGMAHAESIGERRKGGVSREAECGQERILHGERIGTGETGGVADADGIDARDFFEKLQTRKSKSRGHSRGGGIPRTPWGDPDWLYCRDGFARPAEPGTFPLADGLPGRVGRLRGYGNAIVPQVAAEFIKATIVTIKETAF